MAQLLIKAQEPWNNDSPTAPTNRSRLGDIIVVRGDDHVWGREECLPRFIVVKLPNISEADAKHYEQSLMIQDGLDEQGQPKMIMAKVRKYQVPPATVQTHIDSSESVVEIPLGHGEGVDPVADFMDSIMEKTS
jgi:hypothetical protein